MAPSPVVARWELSRRLTARRKEQGVDVKTITAALGFSRNYWSAVENDRTLIAEDKLRLLFDLLDFDESDQTELLQLREDSRKRGWWETYPSLDERVRRFIGLESGATEIRTFDGLLVPGLLQVADYTRSVVEADPSFSPVDVSTALEIRRKRQEILDHGSAVRVIALITEAALLQSVAGTDTQIEQIDRLIDAQIEPDNGVEIRILALDSNPGIIVNSSTLVFFKYSAPQLPELAFQESVRPLDMLEAGVEDYVRLELAWVHAIERSQTLERSTETLRTVRERLDRGL